jgi:hypothetical protein
MLITTIKSTIKDMGSVVLPTQSRPLVMFLCACLLPLLAYGSTPRQPRTAISETTNVDCGNIKKGLAPYIGNLLGLNGCPLRSRAGPAPQLRLNGG